MSLIRIFRYLLHHHPYEAWALFVFLVVVTLFYILAVGVLLDLLAAKKRHPADPMQPWLHWFRCGVLGLAVLGIISLLYAWVVEPSWLEVTRVRLYNAKLPKGLRPLKVVQISDIHSNAIPRLEESLPDIIAGEKPDLVVFTGDAINSVQGLPVFRRCLSRLSKLAPTLGVTGNWEVAYQHKFNVFDGTGVKELKAEAVPIKIAGVTIWVAGVPVDHQDWDKALDMVPAGALSIFLDHYPDAVQHVAGRKVDLYLCGHTHGGQIAIPFYGALVTFSNFGKRYEAGLYKVDNTWLYVNRGIGMDPEPFPQLRFCARPEVTVFEIAPQTK